jgi:hypothetical protein
MNDIEIVKKNIKKMEERELRAKWIVDSSGSLKEMLPNIEQEIISFLSHQIITEINSKLLLQMGLLPRLDIIRRR